MALVGKVAQQIAEAAGLVPMRRRAVSQRTFWCYTCDRPSAGVRCAHDTTHDGITHGSAAECGWYQGLVWRQGLGEIRGLCPHPVFLLPGGIRYTADAEYWEGDTHCVAEYKSTYTARGREWRRTRRLFKERYPEIQLVEVIA